MTMTSKRLELEDAKVFCDMMNFAHEVLQEAYNNPGKPSRLGLCKITYNPLSQTFIFQFGG